MDNKALNKLGLQEKDFIPIKVEQEKRIAELEKALSELLNEKENHGDAE